ncbi:MAG: putative hydrolases or acyltransferases (alpha/beta hydrolase superfamily) [Phormidesmis priestleyi Ana]|uniref:Putative hydrolases or acyltransferases (Alpha/beta hydrolase superfamily) n=1 Tax=Phormidesmis priestleyi Ana TaxID=1666911 RepID=A0A0P7ZW06_9CYAN|nr:MAG: putative hydrolases or acyltransferases (alpha/beta hydrolase superfamily) [Phormidesmis priestleyi Ana]
MSVFTSALASEDMLPAPFKTYAPDLRGYGRSRSAYAFEMTRHLDDLEALIAQYQIEKCLVLGWSLGGILAMELALRRPELVQGLILVGTAARPVGSHPPITWQDNLGTGIAGILNLACPGHALVRAIGQRSLFRYLIAQHTPLAYEYLAKEGAPAYLQTSRHAASALFGAIRAGYNRLPDVKRIGVPALMLCGECDRHITAESSLETARVLPHCEVRCYPNTAHLFPWEIPQRMNADIRQWLTAHSDCWQL